MDNIYCICGGPYEPDVFMIQCDACKDWFHGRCCNISEYEAIDIEKFHCPRCMPLCGPSQYKMYKNGHRHDYWDASATTKPVQTGTPVFIRELRARHFASEGEVVLHMRGQQLTELSLQQQGFNNPIVVDNKEALGMAIPPENFSVFDVESCVGGDLIIDVIDVTRQSDIKMKLAEFVAYYNNINRSRIFNVISLEVSSTGLSKLIEAPLITRKLDWVHNVWPKDYILEKPHVQKYCLMSVKDSYTDFHIDFGGTSVWYHVLRGEKIFYFIRPTIANLTLYQQWVTSRNQSETFFGDQVDNCYKCTLRQGQTMFIPTGWIHAVLTPVDSLVFGGNFLHSLNIPLQLQIYEIEKKTKTAEKFRFPFFETINWFAAQNLLEQLQELNLQEKKCPNFLLVGLRALLSALKHWNNEKDYKTNTRDQIPVDTNSSKLLKNLSKEIRHAERFINTLNPPKPERESKRKKKKPVNKDFIAYSLSPRASTQSVESPPPIKLTLPKPAMYPYERMPAIGLPDTLISPSDCLALPKLSRQEETTAIHRGGAVLKFKLGTKDIFSNDYSPQFHVNLNSPNTSKSIYDFQDDSDKDDCIGLSIDESPVKQRKVAYKSKLHGPANSRTKKGKNGLELNMDNSPPKNGIESLLKASVLTNKFVDEESGRTSPSTEDAIVGMLSIGQTYIQPGRNAPRTVRKQNINLALDEENINNVHQDDDYIYPSLDNSDDEDLHSMRSRGKSKVDEAWNPKARVGPLLPKMNRPAREGTKKQAVEKVLEAAAAKRATESPEKSPKRQYKRKKVKQKLASKPLNASSSSNVSSMPSTGATMKPRKGMKTAKQRLGKILKIHKMIY